MEDLASILAKHQTKLKTDRGELTKLTPSFSEIPDVFFDIVLVKFHLSRIDILVLLEIYRRVWCRPNLYKAFGIGPILSHQELATKLNCHTDEFHQSLFHLKSLDLIETIRSGQYFVRKFFTKELDEVFGHVYEDDSKFDLKEESKRC